MNCFCNFLTNIMFLIVHLKIHIMKKTLCILLVSVSMLAFSVASHAEQSQDPFHNSVIKAADFHMTCHVVPVAILVETQTDAILVCENVSDQAYQVTDVMPVSSELFSDVRCKGPPTFGLLS